MLYVVLSFVLSFIQSYIATLEVYYVSRVRPVITTVLTTINCVTGWLVLLILIYDSHKVGIIIADVLGNSLATYLALIKVKNGNHNGENNPTSGACNTP